MDLLLGSERPTEDRRDFMWTQVVFRLLAAIDGHAKNFSISLKPGGGYRLTPRYDILSAYPVLGHGRGKLSPEKIRMAMAVSGKNWHYRWQEITARHWLETAKRLIEQTPEALEEVSDRLPRGFPEAIASAIVNGIAKAANELGEQLAEGS